MRSLDEIRFLTVNLGSTQVEKSLYTSKADVFTKEEIDVDFANTALSDSGREFSLEEKVEELFRDDYFEIIESDKLTFVYVEYYYDENGERIF